MTTAGASVAVGTEDAFADGLFIPVVLFFVDKAVGDEVAAFVTVMALQCVLMEVEFKRERVEGIHVLEIDGHGVDFSSLG